MFEFYSHSPFWGTIIWVVINPNPVMSQLVRVDQGMIHVAPEVQSLMEDKDVPFASERVAPCGRDSSNWHIWYRRKGVVKPLYFTLLASIEYRSAILAGTTSVGPRVELTSGFVAEV